jgi:hypothetical protein
MTLTHLISTIQQHGSLFPMEQSEAQRVSIWIQKHQDFAFVKENLDGHVTASIFVLNQEKTKVLLMFHKKYQEWTHFG